ncbi:MAG TPA: hypothetical protein VGH87_08740 [Polyangiaceae bacterium]|jgi:hypothetical protein
MTRKFLPVLGRRDLLRYGSGVAVTTLVPIHIVACDNSPPPQTGFFTDAERAALGALANAVLPPDDTPGGKDLGAIQYIEKLCIAFDGSDATHAPAIYGGGPFSGRMPFADDQGNPSTNFPPNSFANFLFLDRVKDAGWRLAILGPSATLPQPNVGVALTNGASIPVLVGLRDRMKAGLKDAMQGSIDLGYGELATLSQQDLVDYLNKIESNFRALVIDLVQQACFCPPEYGGNLNLAGWKLAHFEGDPQPLGYSVWSTAQNKYVERADAPMSTPNATDPEPLSTDVVTFIDSVINAFPTYAKKFS